jgi:hypothetical protein
MKLWQVTQDPTHKMAVTSIAKIITRMTCRKALEKWETKVENYRIKQLRAIAATAAGGCAPVAIRRKSAERP